MRSVIFVVTAILAWIFFYMGMPTFSFGFAGWSFYLLILSGLVGINFLDVENDFEVPKFVKQMWIGSFLVFFVFLMIIIPVTSTWSLFRSDSYKNLIGNHVKSEISSDLSPISPENIVIIDEETAAKLGEKKLTETNSSLGSEVEIGGYTLQKVDDKLYYVAPLLHSGFFKWTKNNGTPGYIQVSALNDKDVKLVQNINGKPICIKYQPNAYYGENLKRHYYFNGFMTRGIDDYSFEIDDQGNPFWCATVYEKKIGYSGKDAIGVAIMDPENGNISYYDLKNIPTWIDRVQPLDFIEDQLSDWGEYVNGWLNPSDKGKMSITEGASLVYGDDNNCYYFIGLTSAGKDQASSGFALVNTRTKEFKLYNISGATENAAIASAKGKWPEKDYQPTFPRPYNVDGHFTYVMALKDKEGLIKAVALVNYKNYEIVGIGEDLKSALRDYSEAMLNSGNAISTSNNNISSFEINDVVKRVERDIQSGQTYYYIILKGENGKIFRATSGISEELVITNVGDSVSMAFRSGDNPIIDISSFKNKEFIFRKTDGQKSVEKYFKQVNDSIQKKQDSKDADLAIKNLTAEEKIKMLDEIRKKK